MFKQRQRRRLRLPRMPEGQPRLLSQRALRVIQEWIERPNQHTSISEGEAHQRVDIPEDARDSPRGRKLTDDLRVATAPAVGFDENELAVQVVDLKRHVVKRPRGVGLSKAEIGRTGSGSSELSSRLGGGDSLRNADTNRVHAAVLCPCVRRGPSSIVGLRHVRSGSPERATASMRRSMSKCLGDEDNLTGRIPPGVVPSVRP